MTKRTWRFFALLAASLLMTWPSGCSSQSGASGAVELRAMALSTDDVVSVSVTVTGPESIHPS